MTLHAFMWNGSVDGLSSCVINNMPLDHIIFGTFFGTNLSVEFLSFCFMYLCICLCFLCIVICMHNFHSAHIFIVYNSAICSKPFNILFLMVILF